MKSSSIKFLYTLSCAALLLALVGIQPAQAIAGSIRYATPGGLTSGACDSWANACDLQYALTSVAVSGDQIWVKKGMYTPSTSDVTISFQLETGVEIYGGFAGTETQLSQRNPAANVTILSGDIDHNDINTDGNNIDETWGDIQGLNSKTVVIGSGTDSSAVLDGFTITGANKYGFSGGGMYNDSGSPTLRNLTFSGNYVSNVTGDVSGAGMYNLNSSPSLTNVTFSGNNAPQGAGMGNYNSSPSLTNVTLSDNQGGGMYNYNSSPNLTNVTFSNGSRGFEMYNINSSSPILTNVIIAKSTGPGDCYNVSSSLNAASANNLIDDTTCGLTDGTNGNKIGSGYAVNLGPLQNNGGSTQTMALLPGSAAIDAGTNNGCPTTDQRGVTRPQGSACDIGAYELLAPVTAIPAASTTGLVLLGLLLAAGAVAVLRR